MEVRVNSNNLIFEIGKAAVMPLFLMYYFLMINNDKKLGAFIVPTGIGASIGGYAGDASCWARKFTEKANLIVNPNVVNAGGFSGINDGMLYVEGYSLDDFFKGNINLLPSKNNKIGIVFDKSIPLDVLNVHLNTMNAVRVVYGVDIVGYEITEKPVGVDFLLGENGVSAGSLRNEKTMLDAARKLLEKGAEAIALVCMFEDPEDMNEGYSSGVGTDPVGGVEAILSHYISAELCVPCAHSPAFADYSISSDLVNPKSSSEYITPTFLPCILLGLSQAPKLVKSGGLSVKDVDFLVMPCNSLGSIPVFEALKRNIKVYAVNENTTALNITRDKISDEIIEVKDYETCFNLI